MLAELGPKAEDVWVFGYGSLMWNPAFHHMEARSGRIFGYHRRFVFWSTIGRGSREHAGHDAGARRRGGSPATGWPCRIAADESAEHGIAERCSCARWCRPVAINARWVKVRTAEGGTGPRDRLRRQPRSYLLCRTGAAGGGRAHDTSLSPEGELGSSRDYLYNTVSASERARHRRSPACRPC